MPKTKPNPGDYILDQMVRATQIAEELSVELIKSEDHDCTSRAKMGQFCIDLLINPELEKRWRKADLPESTTSKVRDFMEQTAREWMGR